VLKGVALPTPVFRSDTATAEQIAAHLRQCDPYFVPSLSSRVDIAGYALKIATRARRFEAWSADLLIGLVAAYCGDSEPGHAFLTDVSVLPGWTRRGIATRLLHDCIGYAKLRSLAGVRLEVARDNAAALHLYESLGFAILEGGPPGLVMHLDLEGESE